MLYGNDSDEETNPSGVGLDWVVTLDDGVDFLGREALVRIKERGLERGLVCLRALDRGIIRPGPAIRNAGSDVCVFPVGGFSATPGVSIVLGFVRPALVEAAPRLLVVFMSVSFRM